MTNENRILNYLFVEMTAELFADARQSQILSRSVLLSIVLITVITDFRAAWAIWFVKPSVDMFKEWIRDQFCLDSEVPNKIGIDYDYFSLNNALIVAGSSSYSSGVNNRWIIGGLVSCERCFYGSSLWGHLLGLIGTGSRIRIRSVWDFAVYSIGKGIFVGVVTFHFCRCEFA